MLFSTSKNGDSLWIHCHQDKMLTENEWIMRIMYDFSRKKIWCPADVWGKIMLMLKIETQHEKMREKTFLRDFLFLMKVPHQRKKQNETEMRENMEKCSSERTHSRYFYVIMYNKTHSAPLSRSFSLSVCLLLSSSILRISSFPLRNQLPGQICWNAIMSFPSARSQLFSSLIDMRLQ